MSALADVRDNRYKKSLKKVSKKVDTCTFFAYFYIIKLKERDMEKVANAAVVAMGTLAIAGLLIIVGSAVIGKLDVRKFDTVAVVAE